MDVGKRGCDDSRMPGIHDCRVALISIVLENPESAPELNGILHDHRRFIIGRMGIPYRERGIFLISIAVDAPEDDISALAGRVGMLEGVRSKVLYQQAPAVS